MKTLEQIRAENKKAVKGSGSRWPKEVKSFSLKEYKKWRNL